MSQVREGVELLLGDSLEVLRTLPPDSVDAIVCDPPYALEFMGRGWDSFRGEKGDSPMRLFQAWCEEWAREALRVAKPGAYLVPFGGSRTYHRLTCGLEDAGWEVRDCLSWLYGSGFPKSLDVSKAFDRRRQDRGAVLVVTRFLRQYRDLAKATNADLDALFGFNGMAGHWTSDASQPLCPTLEQWATLKAALAFGDELDGLVRELNGRDAEDEAAAFAEREVLGQKLLADTKHARPVPLGVQGIDATRRRLVDVTAPETDLAVQWAGWGTALKPAWEPIVLARKPLVGGVATNVEAHGTGALNVDGCRIIGPKGEGVWGSSNESVAPDRKFNASPEGGEYRSKAVEVGDNIGRWPANVLLDEAAAALLDAQSGERGAAAPVRGDEPSMAVAADGNVYGERDRVPGTFYADQGGASRFFYCAKASREERERGLAEEGLERRVHGMSHGAQGAIERGEGYEEAQTIGLNRLSSVRNHHPTVKPLALMRWLCRLVTPPGGLVLDPFTGSGTTGIAAWLEGLRFLGIEREPEYFELALARLRAWTAQGDLFAASTNNQKGA